MSIFKIALAAGALVLASPLAAQASQDYKDCFYSDKGCSDQLGQKVTTYSLYEGGNPEGFDPLAVKRGEKVVKVTEPAKIPYQGGNLSN